MFNIPLSQDLSRFAKPKAGSQPAKGDRQLDTASTLSRSRGQLLLGQFDAGSGHPEKLWHRRAAACAWPRGGWRGRRRLPVYSCPSPFIAVVKQLLHVGGVEADRVGF